MTSQKASYVKRKGHADAREFAELLGIGKEYKSEPQAKKDVIDSEGHSYSVKSGEKKWQIFLYGKTRFETDYTFRGMNGLGDLFLQCINSFPENRAEYLRNKDKYKRELQHPMRELCKKLKERRLLAAFIDKAMFNSGEVDFLVIKEQEMFHIFWSREVVEILVNNYVVENSKARIKNQVDDQKVICKVSGKTYGEIEMRNDSEIHYREIKFWLDKKLTFNLLKSQIGKTQNLTNKIIIYGNAIKRLSRIYKRRR
jgi:hypothetical protein